MTAILPAIRPAIGPAVRGAFDGFRPSLTQLVRTLFSASEPGAWYDPSDMSTLFQDSAGTTPVTAVEQPVGRMLDKSGRGNHASQATTTKRPVLSRRVNLLVGSTTLATQSITTLAAGYKIVFSGTGSVTLSGTATGVYGAGTNSITCTAGTLTLTVSGSVQDASFHLLTDSHLAYQWVNTNTDYDADPSKFPAYLRFDGVDDAMKTANIDFTGTSKMTVWAGVARITQTATASICELSTTVANDGVFALGLSSGDFSTFISRGVGGGYPNAYAPLSPAPVSAIIGGAGAINDLISTARSNGVSVNSNVAQGTGNYGNYPLYIGGRGGVSQYFDGRLYSLIVRGAQTPLSQIEATERYIKQKMRLP